MSKLQPNKVPNVQEKMLDRPKRKVESSTDAALSIMRKAGSMEKIELCMIPLQTDPVKRILEGRTSCKVLKLRQHFIAYTDRSHQIPTKCVYDDLLRLNKYVQSHVLYTSRSKDSTQDNSAILYLNRAEVPQILLEVVHQACSNPDYFNGPLDSYCIPYLVFEILTCFMHPNASTFQHFADKLFVDSSSRVQTLSDISRGRYLRWFDRFAVSHFFGAASVTPQGKYWLYTHLDTYQELCSNMAKCGPFIKEQTTTGDIHEKDKIIMTFLKNFREVHGSWGAEQSARIFGHFVTGQCIHGFLNILTWSRTDYEKFYKVSKAVRAANVLGNFHTVIKQVMGWSDPTHFLLPYLNGVSYCLEMERGFEELFINDITSCLKGEVPVGMESLVYWTLPEAERTFPCRLAWFLVHAFCLDDRFGCGWCVYILTWCLARAPDHTSFKIIEHFGAELMDLAHMVTYEYPEHMTVQAVILEAMLRHGGIGHLDSREDTFEGDQKDVSDLKEFSLEAASFSKKARCEGKMSLVIKQRRVLESDQLKEEGNTHFKAARYHQAIQSYTEAIAVCPLSARTKQAIYYSNRAECYLRAEDYMRTVHDCNRSLCLDKSLKVKVQWRRAKAYQKLNLDYAAWLDMRCVRDEWTEEAGVDFENVFRSLEDKLDISTVNVGTELLKQFWYTWLLTDD